MSHVDEGTLHAYLDGELPPVERERVDTHLKGCPACQARLAEERALIERATRLLGMAAPPERAMPPLQELRQPRLTWRLRRPLTWAATLILAVGLGWVARGMFPGRGGQHREVETDKAVAASPTADSLGREDLVRGSPVGEPRPRAQLATREARRSLDSMGKARDAEHQLAGARATDEASNAPPGLETTSVATPVAAPGNVAQAAAVREGRAPAPAPDQAAGIVAFDSGVSRQRSPASRFTAWPLIARQPARDILGVEPVIIPGFTVRAYRRNPAAPEIVVEQLTDAGTPITLIERLDSSAAEGGVAGAAVNAPQPAAKSVNERLARFVGALRVEIEGPLTPDSLSNLLELAR